MTNTVGGITAQDHAWIHVGDTHNNYHDSADKNEQDAINQCLSALRLTDPRDDKTRIEKTKGGLLEESYRWVLQSPEFVEWCQDKDDHLLWIRGNPGKGKTMLLCGIVDELQPSTRLADPKSSVLMSYFFCQATNSDLDNGVAVLRGLIYLLAVQRPSLTSYIREKYHGSNLNYYEHWNSWHELENIFRTMLHDPIAEDIYLVVDALDECREHLTSLLELIASTQSKNIKWIVSSRNRPDLEELMSIENRENLALSLELNEDSVSQAVTFYIDYKMERLDRTKNLRDDDKDFIKDYLHSNAHGTFLWVALICQQLEECPRFDLKTQVQQFPPGLNSLYARMIEWIQDKGHFNMCRKVLAVMLASYRPISIKELTALWDLQPDEEAATDIVKECGSFLIIESGTVSFIHQSAKDFLSNSSQSIFTPTELVGQHYAMFQRSLIAMDQLKQNPYGLPDPGIHVDEAISRCPKPDPLAGLEYSCIFWVDHLTDSQASKKDIILNYKKLKEFLIKKSLFWIEALVLRRCLSSGTSALDKLKNLLVSNDSPQATSDILELLHDIYHFLRYFRSCIEKFPFQIYVSGMLFSPTNSRIKREFQQYKPQYISGEIQVPYEWDKICQILESNRDVLSLSFSPGSDKLAAFDANSNLVVWNTNDCAPKTTKLPQIKADQATLSRDWKRCATWSEGDGVKVWHFDVESPKRVTIEWVENSINSNVKELCFSPDGKLLAVRTEEVIQLVRIGIGVIGAYKYSAASRPMEDRWGVLGNDYRGFNFSFSSDSRMMALVRSDDPESVRSKIHLMFIKRLEAFPIGPRGSESMIDVINTDTGNVRTVRNPTPEVFHAIDSIQFLPDRHELGVYKRKYSSLWVMDTNGETWKKRYLHYTNFGVPSLNFSPDGNWLAMVAETAVLICDAKNFKELLRLKAPFSTIVSVSPDSRWLALRLDGSKVYLFDVHAGLQQKGLSKKPLTQISLSQTIKNLQGLIISKLVQSNSGQSLVSYSAKLRLLSRVGKVKVWDANTLHKRLVIRKHVAPVNYMAFSSNDRYILIRTSKSIEVFDSAKNKIIRNQPANSEEHCVGVISNDGRWVAESDSSCVRVWDLHKGSCCDHSEISQHASEILSAVHTISLAFGPMTNSLAIANRINNALLWDFATETGRHIPPLGLRGLEGEQEHPLIYHLGYSPDERWLATGTARHVILRDAQTHTLHAIYKIFGYSLDFNFLNNSTLSTSLGKVFIDDKNKSLAAPQNSEEVVPTETDFLGCGLLYGQSWVTWHGNKILWLPLEYRAGYRRLTLMDNGINFFCANGLIFKITINPDNPNFASST